MVDASNVSSYIKAVVDALLETGIKAQLDAFRSAIICRKLLKEGGGVGVSHLLGGDHAQCALCGWVLFPYSSQAARRAPTMLEHQHQLQANGN